MMSDLERQFLEDRALRDAALAVLKADIEHAKVTFSGKGLTERVTSRISDGAQDVFETAKEKTDDHLGIIAMLVGAILLWLSREPIFAMLGIGVVEEVDESPNPAPTEQPAAPAPSPYPPGDIDV